MENVIKEFNRFVRSIQKHENLSVKVKNNLELPLETPPKKYYDLKELCNPQATYWSRTRPEIVEPRKLKIKLNRGTRIHERVGKWLATFDNFLGNESILDGHMEGFEGIRGKIDCRLGDAIVEIKSKGDLPKQEEVISLYPQDVEQIAFYSVMHPNKPKINYIVFIKDKPPFELIVFKVITKDITSIGDLLRARKSLLDKALKEKDPSGLGRCRYRGILCRFEESKACSCDNLTDIPLDIGRFLEITKEEKLSKELESARDKAGLKETYSVWEILLPRKSFIKRNNLEPEREFHKNEVKEDREYLLKNAIKKLKMGLSNSEFIETKKLKKDSRLSDYWNWLRIEDSKAPDGEIVPYVIDSNLSSNRSSTESPNTYALAELSAVVAGYSKKRGFIFVIYPNLDNHVQVFEVNFKEEKEFYKIPKVILDALEATDEVSKIENLPICPNRFYNKNKECVLTSNCNPEGKKGCLYYA